MAKKSEKHLVSGMELVKPATLHERTVDDYSDIAEMLQECNFPDDIRHGHDRIPTHDFALVAEAGRFYADAESMPQAQCITIACWVYWSMWDDIHERT